MRPQKPAGFRPLAHTADAAFKLWGATAADIFIQGAQALYGLMTDRRRLRARQVLEVAIAAPDQEALLVDWLNHLLYLYDTKSFLAREIDILEISGTQLKARLRGEALDSKRHILKTGVKAATYYLLSIYRTDAGWQARILFDV